MTEFTPLRPDEGGFPPLEPETNPATVAPDIPDLSLSDSKIHDVSVTKLRGVGIKVSIADPQVVADATEEVVEFDTTTLNQGFADLDTTAHAITLPYTGLYHVVVRGQWESGGTGRRRLSVQSDISGSYADTEIQDHQHVGGTVTHVSQTTDGYLGAAGEHLRVRAFNTNGGADLDLDNCRLFVAMLFTI